MRKIGVWAVSVAGLLVLVLAIFRTPDTDPLEMRAKYGGPSSAFVESASGMSIHYRDQGCRECPAILLIHGANASLHTFAPLVERLSDRYRLVSYDQPGHGLTGPHPREDYSAHGMFEAVSAVVDAVGIKQFVIAGNSMGGWIAWRYALEQPQRVSGLILMNASGVPVPAGAPKSRKYLGARLMRNPVVRFLGQYITPRSVVERSLREVVADDALVTDEMVDRYWELRLYPGNRRAAKLRAVVDREPEYAERLGEISVPTLVLWGAEDRVTLPRDAEVFGEMIPNARVVVFDGVAHATMEEAPDRTASEIDRFLKESGSMSAGK